MKLELKHLAPYLPYDLRVRIFGQNKYKDYTTGMKSLHVNGERSEIGFALEYNSIVGNEDYFKPILRPFSDLTKNEFVEDLGEWIGEYQELDFEQIEYGIVANYFKHHFDVFGLIEKGLAIDINTLNN